MKFVHLHNHTQYSTLDGLCKIKETVARAKSLGFSSYAITDHGNMFGVIPFYQECIKQQIKPIIGCEFYVAPRGRKDRTERLSNHLILIAKNYQGYLNLMQLSSKSYLEGFYYKPRIDRELLTEYSDGIICLSACLQGEAAHYIVNNEKEKFLDTLNFYKSTFGEDYFLELQNHGIKEEDTVRNVLIKYSKSKKIKLICTNDVHYLNKSDHAVHDVLICIQTGKKVSDTDRMKYGTTELYMKSFDEMSKLFPQEAIENTLLVDSLCDVKIPLGQNLLPVFPCEDVDKQLQKEVKAGMAIRFPVITQEIRARLNYEYTIIKKLGFSSYFLIVQDFIRYAKSIGVPVGPSRGSVGGSMVAFVLGITEVDPIKYNLIFERFLNPDRVSLPDIDVDFGDRDKIIEYVTNKYGSESVSQIVTFGTMGGRSVIRDVARTLNIPVSIADKLAKSIDQKLSLEENFARERHLKELIRSYGIDPDNLLALEDLNRHASVHAAGVLISPDKITNHCPLMIGKNGEVASQYDMKSAEALGLLKMDFLGLKTLNVLDECCKAINVDILNLPLDDKKTYQLISKGLTVGVFQFESAGMREFLMKLLPENIDDLAAMAALFRPGPMNLINSYINRKHGIEQAKYLHPKMDNALRNTFGVMVYQEQVIQLTRDLAGFTLSEGDILRKAIGKKDKDLLHAQRDKFVNGCIKEGNGKLTGERVFDLIEKFADYGFNKAHAVGYALLAYQTAYLKANYTAEFMCALLNSEIDDLSRISIIIYDCDKMGIQILPPSINKSNDKFSVEDGKIRFGLQSIRNIGKDFANEIKSHRPYNSLTDLCMKIDSKFYTSRKLESLISAGCFDEFGTRRGHIEAVETVNKTSRNNDFHNLFEPEIKISDLQFDLDESAQREREALGIYFMYNPLSQYKVESTLISELNDGEETSVLCMVDDIKKKSNSRGVMGMVRVVDLYSNMECVAFSPVLETLVAGQAFLILGKLSGGKFKIRKAIAVKGLL